MHADRMSEAVTSAAAEQLALDRENHLFNTAVHGNVLRMHYNFEPPFANDDESKGLIEQWAGWTRFLVPRHECKEYLAKHKTDAHVSKL